MEKPPKEMSKEVIVFVSGLFNILHPGHFRFLKFARNQGSKLVVGIYADVLTEDATITQQERLANISALAFVDEAFVLECPAENYIAEQKPDIVVKGWEHHDQDNPEKTALDVYGGKLIFSSGDIKISDVEAYAGKQFATYTRSIARELPYLERHGLSQTQLLERIHSFEKLKVCVLGDIIVDHYMNCQPVGMSREDPTIVVRPAQSSFFLGGAGIVAAHARGLGAKVHFLSVSGQDEAGDYSREKLDEIGVEHCIFRDDSRPTTQKKRYRAAGKTLLRVNDYADHPISDELCSRVFGKLTSLISEIDVILFSDFSYGALPQDLVQGITELAGERDIILAADSQSSSQIGDISRFKNLTLVTPTEHEARLALNNYTDGLVQLGDKMQEKTGANSVVITLAEEGIFIKGCPKNDKSIINDRLPALQSSAVDVAGAGDAFFVSSSMALASGASIWEAAYIGSVASAIQVSREGNIPLKGQELTGTIDR